MNIKLFMKTRDGRAYAEAIYTGEITIVLPGGIISEKFAESIRGGTFAKNYRENVEYVGTDRKIIKECEFNSPSIAAQFVNGNSSNGYRVWKVADGKTLGDYLKEKGLK